MPDYSLGKIYKIVGNGKVYIGSTTRPLLSQRLAKHKENYKYWKNDKYHYVSSFDCIDDSNCYIELIESCPCSSKDELLKCEGKWIRETECVNKIIHGFPKVQTKESKKEKNKEYYEANKEKLKEMSKEYYESNKEKHKEKCKNYYEANKEKIKEQQKEYYEANKEKFKEYQKEYRQNKKIKISPYIGNGDVATIPDL